MMTETVQTAAPCFPSGRRDQSDEPSERANITSEWWWWEKTTNEWVSDTVVYTRSGDLDRHHWRSFKGKVGTISLPMVSICVWINNRCVFWCASQIKCIVTSERSLFDCHKQSNWRCVHRVHMCVVELHTTVVQLTTSKNKNNQHQSIIDIRMTTHPIPPIHRNRSYQLPWQSIKMAIKRID
jgi:hypothetical protein